MTTRDHIALLEQLAQYAPQKMKDRVTAAVADLREPSETMRRSTAADAMRDEPRKQAAKAASKPIGKAKP